MKKIFILFLFTFIYFLASNFNKATAVTINCNPDDETKPCESLHVTFINTNDGTTWEVRYRYNYTVGTSPRQYPVLSAPTASVVVRPNDSVTLPALYINSDYYGYHVQWATTCVDPKQYPSDYQNGPDNRPNYFWNIYINPKDVPRHLWPSGQQPLGNGQNLGFVKWTGSSRGFSTNQTSKCYPPTPDYTVKGYVFKDNNGDGKEQASEGCYTGDFDLTVNGNRDNNHTAKTCGTGSDPYFAVTRKTKTNTVCLVVPNGYNMTTDRCRSVGGDGTIKFGIEQERGKISGRVYVDEQPNSKIDGNDSFLKNIEIRRNPAGANEKRVTDNNGRYTFGDLDPGSDHNIRLIEPGPDFFDCKYTLHGDNPKLNVNAISTQNDVDFRLSRKYYEIRGNVYRCNSGTCTRADNDGTYNRSITVTAAGTGRSDTSKVGDTPDYRITRLTDRADAYSVRVSGLRAGESVVGGNPQNVNINCANEVHDIFIRPAGATDFSISGSVYVNTNGVDGIQKTASGTTPADEIYDGGGTVQIRRCANLACTSSNNTSRTDTLGISGGYQIDNNPLDGTGLDFRVRLLAGTLADGYTINGTPGNDRAVNNPTGDVGNINFLVDAPGNTYSIAGGVYIDTDPPEGRKADSEDYAAASGTERITITGLDAGNSSVNKTITPTASGFKTSGLPPGRYQVDFSGPNGRGADWIVTYPSGTAPYRMATVTLGPSCDDSATDQDGVALCESSGGTKTGNVTNVDFGIKQQTDQAWYQSIGGDIRVDKDNFRNEIPAGAANICPTNSTRPYFSTNSLTNTMSEGIIFTGTNPDLARVGQSNTKSSPNGWLVTGNKFTPFKPGVIRTSYSFVSNAIKKGRITKYKVFYSDPNQPNRACEQANSSDCNLRTDLQNGVFQTNQKVTIQGTGTPESYTFPANGDFVILIDDDLRIESNIIVPAGSTATFIVSGNISVSPTVTRIDGIYSTDKSFITEGRSSGADTPLTINGNIIANAGLNSGSIFDQRRDLGDAQNAICPAVRIISRPDFILNGPELLRNTNYVYQEVAPGAVDSGSQGGASFDDVTPECVPESDSAFCDRKAKNCGEVSGNDNCGKSRTVSSCGSCTSPQTCGGSGSANVCGTTCVEETQAQFCARRAKNCGTVSGNNNCGIPKSYNCGTCTSPKTCGGGGVANVCGQADAGDGGDAGSTFKFYCQYGAVNQLGKVTNRGSWNYYYDSGKYCDIYGAGCAMTSLSMIMTYYGDKIFTPDVTSRQATNNKYPTNLGCASPGTLTSQLEDTVRPWLMSKGYAMNAYNMVEWSNLSGGGYRGRLGDGTNKANLRHLKDVYIDNGFLILGGAVIRYATQTGLSSPHGHAFVITDIDVANETMTIYDPTYCQTNNDALSGGKRIIKDLDKIDGTPIGCSGSGSGKRCGWIQLFAIKKK